MKYSLDDYKGIHIPIPTKELVINDTDNVVAICKKMDVLFDDVTNGYPVATKNLIREMYYSDLGVFPMQNLVNDERAFAMWQMFSSDHEPDGAHVMFIESGLQACPIVSRYCKFHEVAGHAGQAHQRISDVGIDQFMEEYEQGIFSIFTDQSVSLCEKMLVDTIPIAMVSLDLLSSRDGILAGHFLSDFLRLKEFSYEEYTLLLHRAPDCDVANNLTSEDYDAFHNRKDVKAFDNFMNKIEGATLGAVPSEVGHLNKTFKKIPSSD